MDKAPTMKRMHMITRCIRYIYIYIEREREREMATTVCSIGELLVNLL